VLTVSGLSKRFGGQVVLNAVNWFVPARGRVALVGANGSGKSTFLRIIAGEQEADSGTISLPRGATVGYLAQEVFGLGERAVLQETLAAFENLHEIEAECRRLEEALAHVRHDDPDYAELMAEYSAAREAWDTHGSYNLESRAETVLGGLGFKPTDFQRPCSELSGGWQMRVALAKLLLSEPHLLLLDEPTNHLDLEARDWLEAFLQAYPYTVILVAHDRYFMDQTCDRVSELSRGVLTDFECNYSRYLDEREERVRQQEEAYRLQREEIERIEAFISRFRYQASKAALVQSRIKQLEKLPRLEPPEGMRTVHFRFPQPERSGRVVVEMTAIVKRYGDITVYDGVDLAIERGKKVALVGPNGAGKSTLMRLIAGVDRLDAGTRRIGHNVALSYFAQDRGATLDADKTVLEIVTAAAPMELVPQVRSLLGAFLFSGDAVHKKARVLSGGERSRLALAILLLHPTNCLLLDEPTNHLDLAAKEVLLEALLAYTGTLVFVAHDRYFLDRLPEEVIEVGHGSVVRYLGNYQAYLLKKASEAAAEAPAQFPTQRSAAQRDAAHVDAPAVGNGKERAAQARQREAAKRSAREAEKRAREMKGLEQDITARETRLGELSLTINNPEFYQAHPNPQAVFGEFAKLKEEIDELYAKLERLERAAPTELAS
jgi:ATP-binding cassette subfamily F protein 3